METQRIGEVMPRVMDRMKMNDSRLTTKSEKPLKCKTCEKEGYEIWTYNPFPKINGLSYVDDILRVGGYCSADCFRPVCLEKYREKLLSRFGYPRKYIHNLYYEDKAKELVNEHGLFLHGKAGTGKTTLACKIGEYIFLHGSSVKFISFPKFIMQLQASFKADGKTANEMIDDVCRESVLIIDDFGAEKLTDFVRQAMYCIINDREQSEKRTIITSNYNLRQISLQIDERISSRISGMTTVIELKGRDYRLNKS